MLLEAREVLRIISLPDFDPAEFPHNVLTRRLVESVEDLAAANERLREALERSKLRLDVTLVAFYETDPVECASVCDRLLDPSGELLGRIRSLASNSEDSQ